MTLGGAMNALKCIACKGTHNTVPELKACHTANNALVGDTNTKTVKKAVKTEEKNYQLFTFETQEARDQFVQANPGAQVLSTNVKKVSVFNKETETYETVIIKTFKVIIK
jgi:hypothetical protein